MAKEFFSVIQLCRYVAALLIDVKFLIDIGDDVVNV
jgi:hypothetical protein